MGARAAKKRATARSAKKRASASPAPVELEPAPSTQNTSATVTEKRVSTLSKNSEQLSQLTKFQIIPTRKARIVCKDPSAKTASKPVPSTASTQGALLAEPHALSQPNLAEPRLDLAEPQPDLTETESNSDMQVNSKRPERRAHEGFTAMLAQIAEEPEYSEADRSIGDYNFHNEEWELWKSGPERCDDEYEVASASDSDDETQSLATAATLAANTRLPPGRHTSKLSKSRISKTKGSKRKHRDLDPDSDDDAESDSESAVEGECGPFRRSVC